MMTPFHNLIDSYARLSLVSLITTACLQDLMESINNRRRPRAPRRRRNVLKAMRMMNAKRRPY